MQALAWLVQRVCRGMLAKLSSACLHVPLPLPRFSILAGCAPPSSGTALVGAALPEACGPLQLFVGEVQGGEDEVEHGRERWREGSHPPGLCHVGTTHTGPPPAARMVALACRRTGRDRWWHGLPRVGVGGGWLSEGLPSNRRPAPYKGPDRSASPQSAPAFFVEQSACSQWVHNTAQAHATAALHSSEAQQQQGPACAPSPSPEQSQLER